MPLPTRLLTRLLWVLLVLDALLLLVHVLHTKEVAHPYLSSEWFALQRDRGVAELFQYLKEGVIAVSFLLISRRTRERAYLAVAALFGYLLLDDAFLVHERLGQFIAAQLAYAPALRLRASDLGELTVQATVGALAAVTLGLAYLRSSATARRAISGGVVLLAVLAFFGVAVDMLHSAVGHLRYAYTAFTLLEEGGELVAMSLLTSYAATLLASTRSPDTAVPVSS